MDASDESSGWENLVQVDAEYYLSSEVTDRSFHDRCYSSDGQDHNFRYIAAEIKDFLLYFIQYLTYQDMHMLFWETRQGFIWASYKLRFMLDWNEPKLMCLRVFNVSTSLPPLQNFISTCGKESGWGRWVNFTFLLCLFLVQRLLNKCTSFDL